MGGLRDDIEVDVGAIETVGQEDWKAPFTAARPANGWGIAGEVRTIRGRLVISRLVIDLDATVATPQPRRGRRGRRPKLTAVNAMQGAPAGGIDSALLHRIPLSHVLDRIRTELLTRPRMDELYVALGGNVRAGVRLVNLHAAIDVARTPPPPKRGRPGLGEDYYRRFALAALRLQRSGQTAGLRRALRQQFKLDSDENVRDRIKKCRELGFLAPGSPGVRGWMPGPRLIAEARKKGGM